MKDQRTGTLRSNIVDLAYPDGGSYIGEVIADTLFRQGKGIFWYPKNDVYMGDWLNDTFHGHGIYFFGSGERYEGELKNGLKDGKGTYYYVTGSYYSGEWAADTKEGQGLYEDPIKQERFEG